MMVFVLLTYGGWNEAAYVSAEIRGPPGSIVRALVWGIVAITALYLLVNVAYLRGLGLAGVAESKTVAADLLARAVGAGSAWVVSVLIAVAAATSVNAAVFTGARTAHALGRDFRPLGLSRPLASPVGDAGQRARGPGGARPRPDPPRRIHARGVRDHGGVHRARVLAVLPPHRRVAARAAAPGAGRGAAVHGPLYPITPLVFCATCAYLLYASLVYSGAGSIVGVAVVAAGALVLVLMGRAAITQPDIQGDD